jgi:cellulose synthase/poly-beta-1,6-N-acetylglucosamine synthase-like glycosyltransferase
MTTQPPPTAATPMTDRPTKAACWPKVSLHLPLRDASPDLVRRTLDSLSALDYPDLEILVVDTHTANPALWEAVAEHCARLGPHIRFFHLGPWPGFRAGALNFALGETAPEAALVGVVKAGHLVRPDWLRRMVPLFRDQGLGLAQTPLDLRDSEPTRFSRLVEAEARTRQGIEAAILPLGTLPLFRTSALLQAGGWDEASLCPEAALGLTLLRHGWNTVTTPGPMARALAHDDLDGWLARRHRHVAGTVDALRRQARTLFSPRDRSLTLAQRRDVLRATSPALSDALVLVGVLTSLVISVLALREDATTTTPWLLMPFLLVLALVPLLRALGHGPAAALGSAALSWRTGRAAWQGLLGGHAPRPGGLRMEWLLGAALWAAALGMVLSKPWGQTGNLLWAGLLLLQSLPCLAALAVALLPGHAAVRPHSGVAFRRHAA